MRGGHLGYVNAEDEGKEIASSWANDTSPEGMTLGLLAGYSWVFDNGLVLGVEADYEERVSTDDTGYLNEAGVINTDYDLETDIKRVASLKGRLGYLLTPRTLVYTTVGLASARVERQFNDYDAMPQFIDADSSDDSIWQDGWIAGFGVEYVVKGKFSVRAEYSHSDYGKNQVYVDIWDETYNHELTEDSFKVGFIYRL
ncbi:MAG: outer membrane immunogenic protein [Porticoccus sp.]|jgi:outer membrane immunogenic protein